MSVPPRLSASVGGSFAYKTVKDRLPSILVSVIDTLHKQKVRIEGQHPKEGANDLKEAIGKLSKLRYEMMTNKELCPLEDSLPDVKAWNDYFDQLNHLEGTPSWFSSSWLYVECYMYRFITSALCQSKYFKSFDPFSHLKNSSFDSSLSAIRLVLDYLSTQKSSPPDDEQETKLVIREFVELSLWGNKCDLSISAGQKNSQITDPLKQLGKLDANLLVDDFDSFWSYLLSIKKKVASTDTGRIDIILDNAGFEFITDLCLAEILLSLGFAAKVVLHAKIYPWFVSDTTPSDIQFCIDKLQNSEVLVLKSLAEKWVQKGLSGSLVIETSSYWTLPFDYADMRSYSPGLYEQLADSDLLIFKGDLNYRKLVGDRQWPCERTTFDTALCKFNPAPLLALRTLKSDVCVGLKEGAVDQLNSRDKDWMVNGSYGVVQFTETVWPLVLPEPTPVENGRPSKVKIIAPDHK